MSKKLEEANAQMKSDMEKMQEELDTQDQIRKQQEEQVVHSGSLDPSPLTFYFLLLLSGTNSLLFVCVPAHKTGRDVQKTRRGSHGAQISAGTGRRPSVMLLIMSRGTSTSEQSSEQNLSVLSQPVTKVGVSQHLCFRIK